MRLICINLAYEPACHDRSLDGGLSTEATDAHIHASQRSGHEQSVCEQPACRGGPVRLARLVPSMNPR